METRIEEYTVGELARRAGVSIRLLHHYDAIGLLKPARISSKGYRLYCQPECLRLQEILFYRAADMPLREIATLLDMGQPVDRLLAHRTKLAQAMARQAELIVMLDQTIAHIQTGEAMTLNDLYTPFTAAKQQEYESWLVATYGHDMAADIVMSRQRQDATAADGNRALKAIETQLVEAYETGQPPEAADLTAHQEWVAQMWGRPCSDDAYAGLAEVYQAHPDFVARFESLSEGFSQWLTTAMKNWPKRQ